MNRSFIFLLFIIPSFCVSLQAQQPYVLGQYVFSPAGQVDTLSSIRSGVYMVDWTIGEPLVETLSGSRKMLSQGFHQRSTLPGVEAVSSYIFSRLDQEGKEKHFSVFPNPFVSRFSVEWNFSENLSLTFEIYNLDGRRIFSKKQNATDKYLEIFLSNLKPSIYILRISDPTRNFSESHKIVKI